MWILPFSLDKFYLSIFGLSIFVILYRSSSKFRYYAKFTYFCLHSAFFATVFLPIMFFHPRDWRNALMPAAGLRLLKSLFSLNWKIEGLENIVQDSGAVVLINHQSIVDLIVLAELWPILKHCTVISKKEICYLGPFGLASYLWGTIFIDRLNPEKAKSTINKTAETIKSRKAKLLMFPEGTRYSGDSLLRFKKGAFHVAISSNLPIQPVVVSRYYYLSYKEKRFDSGYTQIKILPPISTEKYTMDKIDSLIDHTYEVMNATYQKLNKEVEWRVEKGKYDLNDNKDFNDQSETRINNGKAEQDSESSLRRLDSRQQIQEQRL